MLQQPTHQNISFGLRFALYQWRTNYRAFFTRLFVVQRMVKRATGNCGRPSGSVARPSKTELPDNHIKYGVVEAR